MTQSTSQIKFIKRELQEQEAMSKALFHVEEATRNLGLTSGYESNDLDMADQEIKAAARKIKFVMQEIRGEI
jgi:hypothetical protein